MGKINLISMKGSILGIFAILLLILLIPLIVLLSQEKQTLHKNIPTPTPATLSFTSGSGFIAGYVYHDNNKDGEREAEEKPFADVKVYFKQLKEKETTEETLEIKTDSSGYFKFRFPLKSEQDSFMVKVALPEKYKTVDSNPIIVSGLKPNVQKIVEFGLGPVVDLSPTHKAKTASSSPTRTP